MTEEEEREIERWIAAFDGDITREEAIDLIQRQKEKPNDRPTQNA